MALTDKLSAIGVAIREMTGDTWKYSLDEMPTAIRSIATSGGGDSEIPQEAFQITGNCDYKFANGGWDWFVRDFGNKITTKNISVANSMFHFSNVTEIPFALNFQHFSDSMNNATSCVSMFADCHELIQIAPMYNLCPGSMSNMFAYCYKLRELPMMSNWVFDYMHYNSAWDNFRGMFDSCYSLYSIPESFLKEIYNQGTTGWYSYLGGMFFECISLEEVRGLRMPTVEVNENLFDATFYNCSRIKEIIFDTENGAPRRGWYYNQHIDLSCGVGYAKESHISSMLPTYFPEGYRYNDADIKEQPNAWTDDINYSRYNKESAINTINSLPDASGCSGNTITFERNAGAFTTAGAIGDMTDAEIAVAAAKGWTVSFVD